MIERSRSSGQIYQALGVRTVINGRGATTAVGGTLMPPEVLQAMIDAAGAFVVIEELDQAVGRRIAKVMPDDVKAWLRERADEMRIPERLSASHVFLSGHDRDKPDRSAEIIELHRRIVAGESTLAALAGEVSEDGRSNKMGGSLGWFSRDRVPADTVNSLLVVGCHGLRPQG